MTDQLSSQNATNPDFAVQDNPFEGGLVDLLTDDRPRFHPRDFRFEIVYVSWLLNWVFIAPAGFRPRQNRFNWDQLPESIGFVIIVVPIASAMMLVITAPVVALGAWAMCETLNTLGFRRKVQKLRPIDEAGRLFTLTRCLLFVVAVLLMFVLAALNMLGHGLSSYIKIGSRQEGMLGILYVIALIVGWFYLWFHIAPDRSDETTSD